MSKTARKVACKACDGRGRIRKKTEDGGFEESKSNCSRCAGSGEEPGPAKGEGRGFYRRPKDPDIEPTVEEQTRAFLAAHGY